MPNTRTNTPRNALVFDMRTLGRQAGSSKTQELTVPAPDDLRLELVGVPAGAEMALDVKFEAVTEGILVTGSATAPVTGECARCLTPLTDTVTASFTELYLYDDHPHGSRGDRNARHDKHDKQEKRDKHGRNDPRDWLEENSEPADEELYLDGDLLDLEPVLRDAVVLALPMSPLCQEDCPGLCVECGVPLATAGPGHRHDGPPDPRWGALSKFDDQATRRADAIDLQEN